jgi:hypothetical protein
MRYAVPPPVWQSVLGIFCLANMCFQFQGKTFSTPDLTSIYFQTRIDATPRMGFYSVEKQDVLKPIL